MELLRVMTLPFLSCLVLVGIHGYLGLHILARGVIFVDLALAQIAALGAVLALVVGLDHEGPWAYWFSVAFTLAGAAMFALTRTRRQRIPQEAVIGITYAVAAAAGVIALDKAPHGAEELKEMLTGAILWVNAKTILHSAAVYSVMGIVHWVFRDKFVAISFEPERAAAEGISVRFWDFVFYATFGIIITISVPVAGVLLVFTFLIVPAVASALLVSGLRARMTVAYALGMVGSVIGCVASYTLDLPTGAAVVVVFGAMLALIAAVATLRGAGRAV